MRDVEHKLEEAADLVTESVAADIADHLDQEVRKHQEQAPPPTT